MTLCVRAKKSGVPSYIFSRSDQIFVEAFFHLYKLSRLPSFLENGMEGRVRKLVCLMIDSFSFLTALDNFG